MINNRGLSLITFIIVPVIFLIVGFSALPVSIPLARSSNTSCPFPSGILVSDPSGTTEDFSDDIVYLMEGGVKRLIGSRINVLSTFIEDTCASEAIPPIYSDDGQKLPYCGNGPKVDLFGRCPLLSEKEESAPPSDAVPKTPAFPDPLVISNVSVVPDALDSTQLTFRWLTNRASTSEALLSKNRQFSSCDTALGDFCFKGRDVGKNQEHTVAAFGLVPGETYFYVVKSKVLDAEDLPIYLREDLSFVGIITIGEKESVPIKLQIDHTPPFEVSYLKASKETDDPFSLKLTWSPPTDLDLSGFDIYRGASAWELGALVTTIEDSGTAPIHSITSWIDNFLPSNIKIEGVCYTVIAFDSSGNRSGGEKTCWNPPLLQKIRSNILTSDKIPPAPIRNISWQIADGNIVLNWENPLDPDLKSLYIYRSRTPGYLGELIASFVDTPLLPINNKTSEVIQIPSWAREGTLCFIVISEDSFGNQQEENSEQACLYVAKNFGITETIPEIIEKPFSEPAAQIESLEPIRKQLLPNGELEIALLVKGTARDETQKLTLVIESERQTFSFPPSSGEWRKLIIARMRPGEHTAWVEGYDSRNNLFFTSYPVALAASPPVCSDNQDNDKDGKFDFPDDDGCAGPQGDREDNHKIVASILATPTAEAASKRVFETRVAVEGVRSDPNTVGATEKVVSPTTTTSAVIPLLSLLNLNRLGLFDLPNLLIFIVLWTLEVLHLRPKRRRWGQVYDSVSKALIPFARIKLYSPAGRQFVASEVANRKGEYGFSSEARGGEYYLQVIKSGFSFPSSIVTADIDKHFGPIYHGERFKLTQAGQLPKYDVPLDPWAKIKPKYLRARILNLWYRLVGFFTKISPLVLVVGIIFAAFAAVIVPNFINGMLFLIYITLAFLYFLSRRRSFETV